MDFRKAAVIGFFIVVVLVSLFAEDVSGQTGVCYRRRSRRSGYSAYRRRVYYYSYSCGWWGWRRCRRAAYSRQRYTAYRTTYYSQFGCCSGYTQSGSRCLASCSPSCRNGGSCTAPNRCSCPSTWTGSYCQTDVNECSRNTDNCQQVCVNTNGGYRCACNTGYSLNSDGRTCRDNNECSANGGRGPCAHTCTNTAGSYICTCRSGYSLGSDRRSCNDINECTNGQHQCSQNCQNTPGSYTCSCRTGYRLGTDGRSCSDINECSEGTHQCSHNCQNTVGSYTCSCRTGYRLASNGRSCYDINECTEGIHQCAQNCHNNPGSYTCSCNAGYSLDANGRGCSDIDECAADTDGCAQNCQNTVGSYTCSCNAGYRLNVDGHGCDDINECAEGTDRCAQNCHNNIGSYTCSCNIGFRLNTNGYGCDDINECTEGTDRCAQNCHNNVGSYTCSCNSGYLLNANGYGCDDIDECALGTDRCSQNCHNTIGSYTCSCNTGYRLNSDRVTCDDIDECAEGTDRCAQNCHNTIGSYTCSCNIGYRLNTNGYDCDDINECLEGTDECQQVCNNTIGSYLCDCRIGYALNDDGRTCSDVDECALDIDRCDQNCHNNIGSYTCSCNPGWRLDFDGFRCNDINECLPGAIGNTTCHQVCVNTLGSYHCDCFLGWRLHPDQLNCGDINECIDTVLVDECDHTCINTIGSYTCTCDSGYDLNMDGRTCDDLDECADNTHTCAQNCTNIPGSYLCNCNVGYRLDPNGFSCIDIDECALMIHPCEQNCMNTPGSFTCFCNSSYTKTDDGLSCLGAPQDLLLNVLDPRSLELLWSNPRNDSRDGYFENFQVLCTTGEDRNIIYLNTLHNSHAASERITGVIPYTAYNCCVLMTTSMGSSPYACAAARTTQDTPGSPPNSIDILKDSPFNLTVTWAEPEAPNGVIIRYTLYIDYKNGSIIPINFNGSVMSYVIDGLYPYQLVGVSLSASTSVGEGPISTTENVTTAQTPPSVVTNATIQILDDNNVTIVWGTPENENGVLVHYIVTIYNILLNHTEFRMLAPDELKNVTFSSLDPEVPYTIEVYAITEAGEGEPFVQTVFTREGVPYMPNITALARQSGKAAVVTWQPYTLDTSKGFLTKVELAIQNVSVNTKQCPSVNNKTNVTNVNVNESYYRFSDLHPEKEYCVSMRAWTANGSSEYSMPQKLTLLDPSMFQIRFQLPPGIFCTNYITTDVEKKIADIEKAIADYIAQTCNCTIFSTQYITQARLMCGLNLAEFIFQGLVLSTAEKTSMEFREDFIQKWVTEKPLVNISGLSYQIDPYCKVELTEMGSAYCESDNPTVAASQRNGTKTPLALAIEITAGVGGGVLAFILIATAFIIACCCCSRKSVKRKYHEPHREELDIQDPTRNQNVTVSPFVPEQKSAFLVGTNNDIGSNAGTLRKGTAKRTSRVVNDYQPSYGPNEDTLRRIAKKDKEAEEEGTASNVNPTYIDDDFDDFDDY